MLKVVLVSFCFFLLINGVSSSFEEAYADHDRKGTFNKYEEPYKLWFEIPRVDDN